MFTMVRRHDMSLSLYMFTMVRRLDMSLSLYMVNMVRRHVDVMDVMTWTC